MTREEAKGNIRHAIRWNEMPSKEALDVAIKALETLEEFEKAQIITGGRLNGRTYAYKCGLEDGKRKALEQDPKWIPVSEELPNKEGYYLCSVRYMYPPYNFFEPEKVKYMDDVTIQKFDGEFNIEVKAWMPLPAPYDPQEKEE